MAKPAEAEAPLSTTILPIHSINPPSGLDGHLGAWFKANGAKTPKESRNIAEAAEALRSSSIPVAFPTETVYGLGADATRSSAVLGIYKAKRRPADNPLIVHVSSVDQLRGLLRGSASTVQGEQPSSQAQPDPIPSIYYPLIKRFWPGPLTILLPNPPHSPLAPEVTAGLPTFGCRIPSSPLARMLIYLADRPLAAPSANASTRPSPTTAQHVFEDLKGRIEIILDGGPCDVGVESTVVDGLSDPPTILRPGGVGIEEIRSCGGAWERLVKGYQDKAEHSSEKANEAVNGAGPRAPGMKYKHYSPRARVILFESGQDVSAAQRFAVEQKPMVGLIGIIRTRTWPENLSLDFPVDEIALGGGDDAIARGLFAALRDLDERGVQTILIEGIDDAQGDLAAAVMNRLRKAAELDVK